MAIKERSKIVLINYDEILYCKASSNYTIICTVNGQKLTACKCLKEIENNIQSPYFLRIHSGFLINLNYLDAICKTDGYTVKIGQNELPVSKSRVPELLEIVS